MRRIRMLAAFGMTVIVGLTVAVVVLSLRSCSAARAAEAVTVARDPLTEIIVERMKARQERYRHAA